MRTNFLWKDQKAAKGLQRPECATVITRPFSSKTAAPFEVAHREAAVSPAAARLRARARMLSASTASEKAMAA